MRTHGAFYADNPHGGGTFWYSANDLYPAGSFAAQRSAGPPILWSQHLASAATGQLIANLQGLKRQLEYPGFFPANLPFQEEFGTSSGTAGWPADVAGMPPFTGASQLTPPSADPPKGIQLVSVTAVYAVGAVNASGATIGVYRNTYANGVAVSQATLLAASNLTLTFATNPYVTTFAIASLPFEITALTDLFVDITATAGSGGTVDVYGVGFNVNFNYN